jgi:dihydrofolate synthase/folylpolyglutamate synthase
MAEGSETALDWLRTLARFGMRPGLERMRRALSALGNPEAELRFVHVAGTNGKGSVCAMLTSLLSRRLRVGTFTSPAFDGYRGRFMVAGRAIDPTEFERLAAAVQRVAEEQLKDDPLTEFEALTLMALLYFRAKQVDVVVWETGLGGRLDSTNVVMPVVTIITNVGLDHERVLGHTIRAIAAEKAGIIKPGVPLVTGVTDEAWPVVAATARRLGAPCYRSGIDFQVVRSKVSARGQQIAYRGLHRDAFALPLPLFGAHQGENAALALAAVELCEQLGVCPPLCDADLRQGLAGTFWPGRFEVHWQGEVPIVYDGAHNPDAAQRLAVALAEFAACAGVSADDWTMVIGILRDKDAPLMLRTLLPLAGRVIVSQPSLSRAAEADVLAQQIRVYRPDLQVLVVPRLTQAMSAALAIGKPVCCWGSLYTVDEARKAMQQMLD